MDDIVTFSRNAVHNVEPGSTSAGMDVGDQLTVRDCLYALVLRSANEAVSYTHLYLLPWPLVS